MNADDSMELVLAGIGAMVFILLWRYGILTPGMIWKILRAEI